MGILFILDFGDILLILKILVIILNVQGCIDNFGSVGGYLGHFRYLRAFDNF